MSHFKISIPVITRNVYGKIRHYPTDKAQADALARLTRQKTLDDGHLQALEDLGFQLTQLADLTNDPKAQYPDFSPHDPHPTTE